MIPTVSQICSLHSPLEKDIEDYAAGDCHCIELWLGKLESFLDKHTLDDVRDLLDAHNVTAPVASFQGGMLATQGEKRRHAWTLFHRRLDLCQQLGVEVLVVACDAMPPVDVHVVERVQRSLQEAAELAERYAVRLALEFQAKSAFGNNLQTTIALIQQTDCHNLGVCLDVFHFYTGPSKHSDLALLTQDNLFHVQLCDIADIPREFATDSHRIMPGDGDIPIQEILSHLKTIAYERCVSIETMNPQFWQVPALQFGEVAMSALRNLLH